MFTFHCISSVFLSSRTRLSASGLSLPVSCVQFNHPTFNNTGKTRITGPCAMSLELLPLVRSGFVFLSPSHKGGSNSDFAVFLIPFVKWIIVDHITHCSII